jgi:hypothetical protein
MTTKGRKEPKAAEGDRGVRGLHGKKNRAGISFPRIPRFGSGGRENLLPLAQTAWRPDWATPEEDEAWREL